MNGTHLVNHIKNHGLISDSTLHVIGVCSNPVRYQSRYRLAREWIDAMVATPNIQLHVAEAAFGDRFHELTDHADKVDYLQLRITSEAWIKESMINLMARKVLGVNPDAKYLAWIDMDVFFRDPGWALETIHQLQHFQVVQPWTDCSDLGPQGGILQHFRSFGYQHQRRQPKQMHPDQKYYQYAHSGFAWACTRRFWEATQGLMDFAILGSADHHQAFAMIGEVKNTIHGGMSQSFFRRCYEWQFNAMRACHKEVGFTPGRIEHQWHGMKNRRYYRERWQILVDQHYNPDTDLTHDAQGLALLIGKPALEQEIRLYNRSRLEDGIDEA